MDALLNLSRLDLDPNFPTASKQWKNWYKTYMKFIEDFDEHVPNNFRSLVNYVPHNVLMIFRTAPTSRWQ